MLLAMIAAALFNLSSAVAQDGIRYTRSRFCSRELRGPNRTLAVVSLEVDRAHRLLQRTLLLAEREYRATWVFGRQNFDAARPPAELEVHAIKLSRDTQFPVTAALRFDRATVWRGTFAGPTTTVIVPSDPRTGTPASFHPGVDISIGPGEVPSLFGVESAEIVLQSAQGSVVATKLLPMPDWPRLENQLSEAYAGIEDDRRRRRCRPHVIVSAS